MAEAEPATGHGHELGVRGGMPLIIWGALVVAIAVFGVLAFGLQLLPALLLGGGGGASLVVGGAVQLAGGREPRPRVEPDLSFAAVAATLGLTLVLVGVVAGGAAFAWTGLGVLVLAAVGLVRERPR